jgi:hypothetical protein
MNENKIVQFVGFITTLGADKFVERWDYYAQQLNINKTKSTLQKQSGTKNRFRYMSQHQCGQGDFKFSFMNKRASEHFPEHNVRVVHAGGYMPLQMESNQQDKKRNVNVMVFIKNQKADIDFYRQLQLYYKLNIYQAYYENCTYAYIMEFFVKEADTSNFILQLTPANINQHISDEAALYEECEMLHA